jgi:hypothetical protein
MEPATNPTHDPTVEATGILLSRSDADTDYLRRQMELPGQVGRYILVMLGSVILAASAGLWFTHPSGLADALLVFGLVLVVLGIVQHQLLIRGRAHWPDQALLWPDGLELVLHNGEIRAAPWNDPKFVLDLYCRPVPGVANDEIMLVWKMDSKVPPCQLSVDGFDRLRGAAITHGLEVAEFRGDRKRDMRAYEIRPPASSTAKTAVGLGSAATEL